MRCPLGPHRAARLFAVVPGSPVITSPRNVLKSAVKSILRRAFRSAPWAVNYPSLLRLRRSAFQVPAEVPRGFFSQKGQDYRVLEILDGLQGGTFVDVGAFDGCTGSNTLYFERELGWTGLCIEPNPEAFKALEVCRKATCLNIAISSRGGSVPFLQVSGASAQLSAISGAHKKDKVARVLATKDVVASEIQVPSARLDDVLAEFGVARINYLSVDVEGLELEVLETMDFESVQVGVISVENSRGDNAIDLFLRDMGFVLALAIGKEEEIYTNKAWKGGLRG